MREPDDIELELEHEARQERVRKDRMLAHPDCRDPEHPGCSQCSDDEGESESEGGEA